MTVPDDVRDNSIVVLIKVKGKIYAQGFPFSPSRKDNVELSIRRAQNSLEATARKYILGEGMETELSKRLGE